MQLEGATVAALEALGLAQLDSLETCDAVIGGDVMDLLDTTELPDAKVCVCVWPWWISATTDRRQGSTSPPLS